MTKEDVGSRARMTGEAIRGYMNGRRRPKSLSHLTMVAYALGVSTDWLLELTDDEPDWSAPPPQGFGGPGSKQKDAPQNEGRPLKPFKNLRSIDTREPEDQAGGKSQRQYPPETDPQHPDRKA